MEYCVHDWCPYYKKNIEKMEHVHCRVTMLKLSLRNRSYEERLRDLNLFPLMQHRLRGDLIQVLTMIKGIDNMDCNKYFTFDNSNYTRGNSARIIGKQFHLHEFKILL